MTTTVPILPIDRDTKEWIDCRVSWILNEFGQSRIRTCNVLTRHSLVFPNRATDLDRLKQLNQQLCDHLLLSKEKIELTLFDQTLDRSFDGVVGYYEKDNDAHLISIDKSQMVDLENLVATLSHELCHVPLIGFGLVDANEYDHEPLTDLLSVFLGVGIFSSNCAIVESYGFEGVTSSWQIGKQGYFSMPMFGYAWALFAYIRSEDRPEWVNELRLDVRDAYKKSKQWLEFHGYPNLSTVRTTTARPISIRGSFIENELASSAAIDTTKCSYCDAELPSNCEDWICASCKKSIEQNETNIDSEYADQLARDRFANRVFLVAIIILAIVILALTVVIS